MTFVNLRVAACGCCRAPAPATPEEVFNRPALPEVRYRVGTYASFRQAAIHLVPSLGAELADELALPERPLETWTTRESDDYGIALIELWAVVADILTFHQERYVNEAWLRTAKQRDSIRRLADLLGYRLGPGLAASTHLAFTVDQPVELSAELLVQSVPKAGQVPQKYETGVSLAARPALNRVPVYARPRSQPQLAAGRSTGTLAAGSVEPRPGTQVVVFTDGQAAAVHRVAGLETFDRRTVVRWTRPLGDTQQRAFAAGRTFRLFGHAAPPTYLTTEPAAPGTSFLRWRQEQTPYALGNRRRLSLEGSVDGLEAESRVLVIADGVPHLRRVVTVAPRTATVGPQTGPTTRIELRIPVSIPDLRTVLVMELGDELVFQDWEVPSTTIAAGTSAVYVPHPEVPSIEDGRLLVLDDGRAQPMLVEADGAATPFAPETESEFLEVKLRRPTTRALDPDSAHLLGNVVEATHGETVTDEILGEGDAAAVFQTFLLKKNPVTHVADPTAPGGGRSELDVFVDRVRWLRRRGLYGAGPTDRVYSEELDSDQKTTVRFGDGRTGARLPTGRANVMAAYRQGLGAVGDADAGQITTALHRPVGLRGVVNPFPASGGVDPESTARARENAPNTVRTFGRAVSLRDFADLAREFGGVAKALATWVWSGEQRLVHVTVAGQGGKPLHGRLADIRKYLDLRRDTNHALRVDQFVKVPIQVRVAVEVEADRFNEDVRAAVVAALRDHFAFDRRNLGQAVHLSDVYAAVQEVGGVASAKIQRLRRKPPQPGLGQLPGLTLVSSTAQAGEAQQAISVSLAAVAGQPQVLVHVPVDAARYERDTGRVVPAELAVIEGPSDLHVTAAGGITP